ncbi:bifunctional phosphoribosylaminoimidazolecarboxamide formyltransferase/IMP cyclohydrolase [Shouchella lonarensis]|uniref:Bifunctional purine biosynthesis protein PurH n=1 Tax=Shouchella lonarensis TaxID=1464122 RepID=A0A1G6MMT1_9BACI|nr:bifunctional phosphoribosylaminoimidazolecarboxamide formyltransferase/IMP cyclohydrolase [Shouchella lonarensis]SDC56888.1 IMP cyclohydrolase /phosphoribosylaminoimidazolecarboxamide formyltransferase [Shouchella lonarensis]
MKRRALVSVSNKEGLVPFVQALATKGVEIVSTGGTARVLQAAGIPVMSVAEVTGFPEMLAGRVKTLHPHIHGGLLAERTVPTHMAQLQQHDIEPIDYVIVNLYPFAETIAKEGTTLEEAIEQIDIGGPSMIRAAAKNHAAVTVVVDPADYATVLKALDADGVSPLSLRKKLAAKAFRHTAAYDARVATYLTDAVGETEPESLTLTYTHNQSLRYGENPHQQASFYASADAPVSSLVQANQLHGKALSYNNIQDANSAVALVKEFTLPTVVAVKHMNPCGVGTGETILAAFMRAYEADETSIFGGIVALNREVDIDTAQKMADLFLEVIIAPSFSEEAQQLLMKKKNLRLLVVPLQTGFVAKSVTSVGGGILIQEEDHLSFADAVCTIPTKREPTQAEWAALQFGWHVVKHVKSNAIVLSDDKQTLGIGAGQMNRVGAANVAIHQAGPRAAGAVLASDAFLPMADTIELAATAGITAIIQPGGSVRDQDSIDAANKHGMAMVFTGIRHFKH